MKKVISAVLLCMAATTGFGLAVPAGASEGPYLSLAPFVVNIQDGKRSRYLQVHAQVSSRDPVVLEALTAHMPVVRHAMIMLLAHQEVSAIRSLEGRQALRDDARDVLQAVVEQITHGAGPDEATGRGIVEAVYFTELVVQ